MMQFWRRRPAKKRPDDTTIGDPFEETPKELVLETLSRRGLDTRGITESIHLPFDDEDWYSRLHDILWELSEEGRILRYHDGTYWTRSPPRP